MQTYVVRIFDTYHSASVFEMSFSQVCGLLDGVSKEDARAFFAREKEVINQHGEHLWLAKIR